MISSTPKSVMLARMQTKVRLYATLCLWAWTVACNSSAPTDSEARPRAVPPPAPAEALAPPEPPASSSAQPAVTRVGDMQYQMTRVRLDAALDWFEQRNLDFFVPEKRHGTVVGMKLYGIRHGSLAHQLSLNNGDMITEVNGIAVDEWQTIRDELRTAHRLTIRFERQDKPRTLNIAITSDK